MELTYSSRVTVTHDSCNFFPFSLSGYSTLILSFESLLPNFHDYFMQMSRICPLILSVELFHSSCVVVTQGPKVPWFFPGGHSTLLFRFELLTNRSHNYTALIVAYFFTHEVNDILPLSFVWMSHNFRVKVSSLSINKPSVTIHSLWFSWLSHKIPVTLFIVSE